MVLSPESTAEALMTFYLQVDNPEDRSNPESAAAKYYKAALQATNDRSSRITRGEIIEDILNGQAASHQESDAPSEPDET